VSGLEIRVALFLFVLLQHSSLKALGSLVAEEEFDRALYGWGGLRFQLDRFRWLSRITSCEPSLKSLVASPLRSTMYGSSPIDGIAVRHSTIGGASSTCNS